MEVNNNDTDDSSSSNEEINKGPFLKDSIVPLPAQSSDPTFSKTVKRRAVHKRLMSPENRRVHSGPKERTGVLEETTALHKRSNSYGDISQHNINNAPINEYVEQDNEIIFFEQNIKPLLTQMELNHLHGDVDSLIINFDILWKTLEIGNMLGKANLGSRRRSEILTSVYKCTTDNNVLLWLKLSRLFLAVSMN